MKKLMVLLTAFLFILSLATVTSFAQKKKISKKDAAVTTEKKSEKQTDKTLEKEDKTVKKETKESKKTKKAAKDEVNTSKSISESGTVYVTSGGGAYHRSGCKYLKNAGTPMTKSEAMNKYKACKVCKP